MSTATGARSGAGELLADRAYVELRDRIITLAIPPGAPLNEESLGRQLQLGRTPLREAVKRLALENLVAVYPRRGTFVTEINITDLAHVSDVRVQLEGHAAYRAAQRLTALQRDELDSLLAEIEQPDGHGAADLMALDARIHRFVYRCTGNPYLRDTLERYLNLSLRIWYLVLGRLPHLFERVHEHGELLQAIRAGEAERARAIAADHVATFEREIRGVL
ncbi:MAG TPA: GntR family transcriptional regulator [Solirubrobacteraceae bacterium]|nr:GntR family transcriptional regulator [Solirubrobacteraceae bacterium]